MRTSLLFSLFLISVVVKSQIITTDPPFPTQDDIITITYDASQGNQELVSVLPVFAHTGVISNYSSSATDWQHVVGNWGTNDQDVLMEPQGNNIHTIVIQPSTFYNLNADEVVTHLAFVFRNQSGTLVGRNADGSDIFVPLYQNGFNANIVSPGYINEIINPNEVVNFVCESSSPADLSLYVNGIVVASLSGVTSLDYDFSEDVPGEYEIVFSADNGLETIQETVLLVIVPEVNIAAAPLGTIDGINYVNTTAVRLQFYAPNKDYLFVLGDFNNWTFDLDYMMNRTPDGNTWWIDIDGLTSGQEYRFQYYIGEDDMRVAEIYSDKILDYWNDPWIA
jgi:hypothetical protein